MCLDIDSHRVRKVSKGIITTVAGNGSAGYSGDSGPATSAQLFRPGGAAVDPTGNLFIADMGNYAIRKISNGVITTVAGNGMPGFSGDGGPAAAAQLSEAQGVAVDSGGDVYISDGNNRRIRKVSNGVIATVAGGGSSLGDNGLAASAQLSSLNVHGGIAMDLAGNVYITDSGRIRKISDGAIATVAGQAPLFSGCDYYGSAANASLAGPASVAVNSSGNVYIADEFDNCIRKVSNGAITRVAGNGTLGSSGDDGLAINAQIWYPLAACGNSRENM
jgi:hypothetical protein